MNHRTKISSFLSPLYSVAVIALLTASIGCGDDTGTGLAESQIPGGCSDGADNDGNGRADCNDSSCSALPLCSGRDGGRTGRDAGVACACDEFAGCDIGCACDPACTAACACDQTSDCDMGCACDPECGGGCACDVSTGCDMGCACDSDCSTDCRCEGSVNGIAFSLACGESSPVCAIPTDAICPSGETGERVACTASGTSQMQACEPAPVPSCGACTYSDECECGRNSFGDRIGSACYDGICRVKVGPGSGFDDYVPAVPVDGERHGRGYRAGDGC